MFVDEVESGGDKTSKRGAEELERRSVATRVYPIRNRAYYYYFLFDDRSASTRVRKDDRWWW